MPPIGIIEVKSLNIRAIQLDNTESASDQVFYSDG